MSERFYLWPGYVWEQVKDVDCDIEELEAELGLTMEEDFELAMLRLRRERLLTELACLAFDGIEIPLEAVAYLDGDVFGISGPAKVGG